jgi:hypothetical protein
MSLTEMTISAAAPFAGTVINVKEHGAAGDGSTDDTDRLHAAIAASREGDAIYFPPGTYLVTESLVRRPASLYFSLTDAATIKVKRVRGGEPFSLFEIESGPVELRHLTLDLSKPERTEPPRCAGDAPPGILARAAEGGTVDLVISSCRIRHAHGQGIRVGGSRDERPLRAHGRLGEVLHHRPPQIRARLFNPLSQPTRNIHRGLDHRAPPHSSWMDVVRMTRWSATSGPAGPPPPSRSLHLGSSEPATELTSGLSYTTSGDATSELPGPDPANAAGYASVILSFGGRGPAMGGSGVSAPLPCL